MATSDPDAALARREHAAAARHEAAAARARGNRDAAIHRLRERDPGTWSYGAIARAVGVEVELVRWVLTGDRQRKR